MERAGSTVPGLDGRRPPQAQQKLFQPCCFRRRDDDEGEDVYDLISGVFGSAFGGAFGPSPADTGAAAQQANEEAFRRMQDSWVPAPPFTPEQEAEYMRLMMNAQPAIVWKDPPPYEPPLPFWRKRLIRDALSHAEDGLFWWLLAGMALALILRAWMQYAP